MTEPYTWAETSIPDAVCHCGHGIEDHRPDDEDADENDNWCTAYTRDGSDVAWGHTAMWVCTCMSFVVDRKDPA